MTFAFESPDIGKLEFEATIDGDGMKGNVDAAGMLVEFKAKRASKDG